MNRQTIREALILVVAAIVLGFAYTMLTKKGYFGEQNLKREEIPSLELITLEKAHALFAADSALFIDARHEYDYKAGHIRGAINISLKEYEQHRVRMDSVPKDTLIVIYCDGIDCNSSLELATKLSDLGFTQLKIFFGGWDEWKTNNLPLQ